jgi:hypothetical protein
MHIVIYPETLRLRTGEIGAAVAEAEKKGRAWLEQRNADILIWGEVADANRLLRLRFTTASSNSEAAKGYALTETLELPAGFGADFGAVLAAQAASGIRPVYDKPGHALAGIIAPIVEKLRPLAEDPPASLPDDAKGSLWHAYAAGQKQLGEEKGDSARLMTAIAYYRKTLSAWPRERVPLDWAMTQNNLGLALASLGARQAASDPALARQTLAEAREAMAGALEVRREAKASYWVEQSERNLALIDAAIAALPGKTAGGEGELLGRAVRAQSGSDRCGDRGAARQDGGVRRRKVAARRQRGGAACSSLAGALTSQTRPSRI